MIMGRGITGDMAQDRAVQDVRNINDNSDL